MKSDFFSNVLEMWYKEYGRVLPWRLTKDPYAVWISEIILQQTRVAQGMEYYKRFMERFPIVEELACAPQEEVLRYWQGLGYYSRARNLHVASQQILGQGGFPSTYAGIRALKGVGDYTAAAISSISFGLPHAVVDGNVYRVLSRVFGMDVPIDSTQGKKQFAQLAQELLDVGNPGLYNQAIMDFGAVQCVPKSPDCEVCPLQEKCVAWASQRVEELPVKNHKTKVTDRYFQYFLIHVGDEFLLHQRTGGDIWQGLYELPLHETESQESCALHATGWADLAVGVLKPVCQNVKHVLSHRILHADLYQITLVSWPEVLPDGYFRVKADELERYAIPRLVEILLKDFLKKCPENC